MAHTTINEYIQNAERELDNPMTNAQRKRHIENEIERLQQYKLSHPNVEILPTALELFCSEYPDSSECKIYDV